MVRPSATAPTVRQGIQYLLASLSLLLPSYAWADAIRSDNRLGTSVTQQGSTYVVGGGARTGNNLFHSFERFSIARGIRADFQNSQTPAPQNVIARVTGGQASTIDGTLSVSIPGANLYFFNPNGLTFGSGAALNVDGSFYASTANSIKFADGIEFSASISGNEQLSTAPPTAFGFLNTAPRGVRIDNAALSVPANETVSLVGGSLELIGPNTRVNAESGNVLLTATAGSETVPFTIPAPATAVTGGVIMLASGARINASGAEDNTTAGYVQLRGGHVILRDDAAIVANGSRGSIQVTAESLDISSRSLIFMANRGDSDGGGVVIDAENVTVSGDPNSLSNATGIVSLNLAAGRGSSINLNADALTLRNRGSVVATTRGTGPSGDIVINAENVSLQGTGTQAENFTALLTATGLFVTSTGEGTGRAGNLHINGTTLNITDGGNIIAENTSSSAAGGAITLAVRDLAVRRGARILSETNGSGDAAPISVKADTVMVAGSRQEPRASSDFGFLTGLFSVTNDAGNAAPIAIQAQHVSIQDGGIVNALSLGQGNVGLIDIEADTVDINANGPLRFATILSEGSRGQGDTIRIAAKDLTLSNQGSISASSVTNRPAGRIAIDASRLTVDGNGVGFTGITASSFDAGTGNQGGQIEIKAEDIRMRGGGIIGNTTRGNANAGDITIRADSLVISGDGIVPARSQAELTARGFVPGVFLTRAQLQGAPTISGAIIASTSASGDAGRVVLAIEEMTLADGALINSASLSASDTGGNAGEIDIQTRSLRLSSAANINAANVSIGSGRGGNIRIHAAERVILQNAGISTATVRADGGNIVINAIQEIRLTDGSAIATSVLGGSGDGGNIAIDPVFLILNNSVIQANAVGGNGGDINIVADNIVRSTDSRITATSDLAIDGNIQITAPNQDVNPGRSTLSNPLLDGSGRILANCETRDLAPSRVTFAPRGPGGLAHEPNAAARATLQQSGFYSDFPQPTDALLPIDTATVSIALRPCGQAK